MIMRIYVCFIVLLLSGNCFYVKAIDLQITTTGMVTLGGSIYSTPSVINDDIILINSSDVILDLGGNTIMQSGGSSGERGIEIAAGLQNVTIQNGTILAMTGTGILINQNCSNIIIKNVTIRGCQSRGIELSGSAGNPINDCRINNCLILQCFANDTLPCIGIAATQCNRLTLDIVAINNSGNATINFTGVRLLTCTACDMSTIRIWGNIGAAMMGFDIDDTVQSMFTDCSIKNNDPVSGSTFTGFNLASISATTQYNMFQRCFTLNNTADSATCIGFSLTDGVSNNIFNQCIVLGNAANTSGDMFGVSLSGATCMQNEFIQCNIMANTGVANANDVSGIQIESGTNYGLIKNCIIAFNTTSATGTAESRGIFFAATVGLNWVIMNNLTMRNRPLGGSVASQNSRASGIFVTSGPAGNSLFTRNIGFVNGATPARQLNGIPSGTTPTAPATQNLTTVGARANIRIAA